MSPITEEVVSKAYQEFLRSCGSERDAVRAALTAALSALKQGGVKGLELPTGAIENGREFARRIEDHYSFREDGGHTLYNCSEWQQFKDCFEHMALTLNSLPAAQTSSDEMQLREALCRIRDFPGKPTAALQQVKGIATEALSTLSTKLQEPVGWQQLIHGKWCNLPEDWSQEECDRMPKGKVFRPLYAAATLAHQPVTAGWQSIESAPKDGTRILVFVPKYGAMSAHFDERWHCHSCLNKSAEPTLWQPIPAPPLAALKSEGRTK